MGSSTPATTRSGGRGSSRCCWTGCAEPHLAACVQYLLVCRYLQRSTQDGGAMGARRVTVLAIGSRGDVDPMAALGIGLAGVGCEVRLVTTADADVPGQATAAGVEAVRLPGQLRPVVSELAAIGANPRVLAQRMRAALVEL